MRFCPKCKKKYPDTIAFCPLDGVTLVGEDPASKKKKERERLENKVVGSYQMEDVLAEGGMGIIFTAKHVKLGRTVASVAWKASELELHKTKKYLKKLL